MADIMEQLAQMSFADIIANIPIDLDWLAYKGFDAEAMRASMLETCNDNKNQLDQDVRFLIVIFLQMGTNIRKIFPKLDKNRRCELLRLEKKYKITKGSDISYEIVTLSRIAAAFPAETIEILCRRKIERPVKNDMLEKEFGCEFPWCLRTRVFFCVIPPKDAKDERGEKVFKTEEEFRNIVSACLYFCYLESRVLNKEGKKKNWSNEEYLSSANIYCAATYKSKYPSAEERRRIFSKTKSQLFVGDDLHPAILAAQRKLLAECPKDVVDIILAEFELIEF